jgi:hypothetical protein
MAESDVVTVQQMDNTRNMKLPAFDGTAKAFPVFWMRFTAYATMMKFAAAIKEAPEPSLPDTEEEGSSEKQDNKDARQRNLNAVYSMTIAFTTETAMNFIYDGQTDEWPTGLAWKITAALFRKFRP